MLVIPAETLTFLNQLSLPKGPIVVGVSGGADSLYLTYLLHQWAKQQKRPLMAVTINHNLRQEATEEALWVQKQLKKQDIHHTILSWEGIKPTTHIEEKAREKRYELLLDYCHQQKAAALFLAHHQHDQAETFWTRLARGSGLDGLCGMAPVSKRENILIIRPLLNMPKENILQSLKKQHLKWVEDPMNQDTNYERVRWRQAQKKLDDFGLNPGFITKSTTRLQRAKEALDFYANEFIKKNLQKTSFGFVVMEENAFKLLPTEIRIRVLNHVLNLFKRKSKILSLDSIEKLALTLPKHATLAGCQWVISHHKIFIAPELKNLPTITVSEGKWTIWGGCQLLTNKAFQEKAMAPTPRKKNIPFLIQRTFLKVPKDYALIPLNSEKELEKKIKKDYKDNTPFIVMKFNEQKDNI